MKFTYLIIDLASFIVPLIFSFHPKIRFHKRWKQFIPVLFGVAVGFLVWDVLFTGRGVWGFNERYLTGIYIYNLPLEEVLFFLFIPYACVFSYHCFSIFLGNGFWLRAGRIVALVLAAALLLSLIFVYDRLYPAVTFTLLALALLLLRRQKYMGIFFFSYLVMLIPFFIVNGILTGTGLEEPVVWYNPKEIAGIRMLTIPVEDVFFGMLLILLNVAGLEWQTKQAA
jgi:lycopene cyclase domain-containing protein